MLNNLIYFILAGFLLALSGTFLIKSLRKISHFLRISEFTAAFIILPVATSSPELFVGISSALQGIPQLSLGNIIGGGMIDLILIIGIVILISGGIKMNKETGKDIHLMLFSIILIIVLYLIGNSLSRIDGIILLSIFIINLFITLEKRKKYKKKLKENKKREYNIILNILIFLIALVVLFFSAIYAVKYASLLASDFNLPKIIVGLFFVSIATTLPEFILGIEAALMHHSKMGIGDLTGGVFMNITLVIGLVAIISPITAEFSPFLISILFLAVAALLLSYFMKTKNELCIKEGIFLILIYVAYVIFEFVR